MDLFTTEPRVKIARIKASTKTTVMSIRTNHSAKAYVMAMAKKHVLTQNDVLKTMMNYAITHMSEEDWHAGDR